MLFQLWLNDFIQAAHAQSRNVRGKCLKKHLESGSVPIRKTSKTHLWCLHYGAQYVDNMRMELVASRTSLGRGLSEIQSALITSTTTEHFHAPLEAKGTDLTSIIDEIEDIVEYARNYLRIGCEK